MGLLTAALVPAALSLLAAAMRMPLPLARLLCLRALLTRVLLVTSRSVSAAVAAALAVTALGAQQKDNNFMTRVTKSHSTVLDPTSQIKNLHPSKHTTIKDWKFGLGLGKDADIIDMMAAKYPSVARDFGDPEAEVKAQIEAESRRGRQEGGGWGATEIGRASCRERV